MNDPQTLNEFEENRGMMFGIAYRMLGSAMEAEDIIQEAYLRYQMTPREAIRSLPAFLRTVVTRLCIDSLKSARLQRETYIGPWLPEPILTDRYPELTNPARKMNEYESISMAFLVLLESLSPIERAVFLLREVFDYDYGEIAEIVRKSESNCRQIFSRAKKRIAEHKPRFQSSKEEHARILGEFLQAVAVGELDGLKNLLSEDVILQSDGGGKRVAATRPLFGHDSVARFLLGIQRLAPAEFTIDIADLNGQPGVIVYSGNEIIFAGAVDVLDGKIQAIYFVRNPDKLRSLL